MSLITSLVGSQSSNTPVTSGSSQSSKTEIKKHIPTVFQTLVKTRYACIHFLSDDEVSQLANLIEEEKLQPKNQSLVNAIKVLREMFSPARLKELHPLQNKEELSDEDVAQVKTAEEKICEVRRAMLMIGGVIEGGAQSANIGTSGNIANRISAVSQSLVNVGNVGSAILNSLSERNIPDPKALDGYSQELLEAVSTLTTICYTTIPTMTNSLKALQGKDALQDKEKVQVKNAEEMIEEARKVMGMLRVLVDPRRDLLPKKIF